MIVARTPRIGGATPAGGQRQAGGSEADEQNADVVDHRLGASGQRRDRRRRNEKDDDRDRHVDPERPPPAQMIGEISAQQRADHGGHTEYRAQRALIAAAIPQRDDLADQRGGGNGDGAAADALQRAGADQHCHRLRQPAQHRPGDEEQHRGLEYPLAAQHITESAGQCGDDRGGQQITGDDPRLMARPAQVGDDRGQRGGDDGLIQRRQQHPQHDRQEDEIAPLRADQCAADLRVWWACRLRSRHTQQLYQVSGWLSRSSAAATRIGPSRALRRACPSAEVASRGSRRGSPRRR